MSLNVETAITLILSKTIATAGMEQTDLRLKTLQTLAVLERYKLRAYSASKPRKRVKEEQADDSDPYNRWTWLDNQFTEQHWPDRSKTIDKRLPIPRHKRLQRDHQDRRTT